NQSDLFLQLQEAISSLEACVCSWRDPPGSGSLEGNRDPSGDTNTCNAVMSSPVLVGLNKELEKAFSHDDIWIQCEISRYQTENAELKNSLKVTDKELHRSKVTLMNVMEEKDTLKVQVQKLQSYPLGEVWSPITLSLLSSPDTVDMLNLTTETPFPQNDPPPGKENNWQKEDTIENAPLSTLHNLIRFLQNLPGSQPTSPCTSEIHPINMETELEWLKGKLDCLKQLNVQLCATLEECKSDSEKLSMQLGKLESVCTAIRLALQSSERCLKTYSVVLALTEAKEDIILGQMAGGDLTSGWSLLPKDLEIKTKLFMMEVKKIFKQDRMALEADIREIIQTVPRLYAPWLSEEDELMLNKYIQFLKQELASISKLVKEDILHSKDVTHLADIIKAKVDNVVKASEEILEDRPKKPLRAHIVQDLMDTKQGLAEVRANIQLLQIEKRALELQIFSQPEQENAYMLLDDQLQQELSDWAERKKEDSGNKLFGNGRECLSQNERHAPPADMQRLLQTLARGSEIRAHVESLTTELDILTCQIRIQNSQSAQIITDFFKAHRNLFTTYQNARRKYFEQQYRLESQAQLISQHQVQELQDLMQNFLSLQGHQATGETSL
ncbi:hypothetical protein GDO86_001118, partial [Hymenochirus boettgeri]